MNLTSSRDAGGSPVQALSSMASARWLNHPLFGAMGPSACAELAPRLVTRVASPGTLLARHVERADQLVVLFEGAVRAEQRFGEERGHVTRFLRAPIMLGDAEILSGEPFSQDFVVIKRAEYSLVPADEYLARLDACPRAATLQLRHLARLNQMLLQQKLERFASIEQRIANLLLCFVELFGYTVGATTIIEYNLTQQEIARSLGLVRRSISPVISAWQRQGVLCKRDGCYQLTDLERLEALALPLRGSLICAITGEDSVALHGA